MKLARVARTAGLTAASWLLLLLFVPLSSCTEEPLTQIVVVVDANWNGLRLVEIDVRGFEKPQTASADLRRGKLPRKLALVHDGGSLGPLSVTVRAYEEGDDPVLVEPRTNIYFVRDKTRMLKVDLLAECIGHCDDPPACIAGRNGPRCVSSHEAAELVPWSSDFDVLPMSDGRDLDPDAAIDAGEDAHAPMGDGGRDRDGDLPDAEPAGSGGSAGSSGQGGSSGSAGEAGSGGDAGDASTDPDASDGGDGGAPVVHWSYVPSNVDPEDSLLAALPRVPVALDCEADAAINSTTGELTGFCDDPPATGVIEQPTSGGDVLVVVMSSLEIAAGSSLRVHGERPVVLLVGGDARVVGTIDASAQGATSGPGGGRLCTTGEGSAGANAGGSSAGAGGGSGGGFGSPGGDGGESSGGTTVSGGATAGSATLVPLRGGCPGGAGGAGSGVAAGGGGGGAIQLSVAGSLEVRGVIVASGAGGAPGTGDSGGGGGGGSGGAILLEAAELALTQSAVLAANGGGGGGGRSRSSSAADPVAGTDGIAGSATAAGGGAAGDDSAGGAGAAVASGPSTDGEGGAYSIAGGGYGGGGGGGGGVGRIVLRGTTTCAPDGVYSPAATSLCESCGTCPSAPGISCVADEFESERFFHCAYALSWSLARNLCLAANLDLATIGSPEVHDYLLSRIPASTWFWFGANDSDTEEDWVWSADETQFWSGDETGAAVDGAFTAWRSGDPAGTGDCGRISNAGWDDASCSDSLGFICGEP